MRLEYIIENIFSHSKTGGVKVAGEIVAYPFPVLAEHICISQLYCGKVLCFHFMSYIKTGGPQVFP